MLSFAFNEEETVAEFLPKARAYLQSLGAPHFEHLIVDDGSSDRTGQLLQAAKNTYPELRVVSHAENRGVGAAIRTAIPLVATDYFFWQTVDWSYDISGLSEYLQEMSPQTVIQGVRRFAPNGGTGLLEVLLSTKIDNRSDNRKKAVVSLINFVLLRLLFRLPLADFQNVAVYPTRLAQSLDLETTSSLINTEMLFKASKNGAEIKQVLIPFIRRSVGNGKGTSLKNIYASVVEIFKFWYQWEVAAK